MPTAPAPSQEASGEASKVDRVKDEVIVPCRGSIWYLAIGTVTISTGIR